MPHLHLKQDIVKELLIKEDEKVYVKKNGKGKPEIIFTRVNEITETVDSIILVKSQIQTKGRLKQDYDYLFILLPQRIIKTKGSQIFQKITPCNNTTGKILAEVTC